jgi:type II secretory pathway pseudopilin PulG
MYMNKKQLKLSNQKGFTLVETLVGISVLIVAITATFTAAQAGLSSSIESKDQVIAYFLGQEAVEAVRNARDDNALMGQAWLTGVSQVVADPCFFGKACTYDGQTKVFTACPSGPGSCQNLKQNRDSQSSTFGMYGYDNSWSSTQFRREIQLLSVNADEVTLTVTMYWSKGIISKNFVIKESILNWR